MSLKRFICVQGAQANPGDPESGGKWQLFLPGSYEPSLIQLEEVLHWHNSKNSVKQ